MVYLQGGPSHLDLWDPKEPNSVPDNVTSRNSRISPPRSLALISPRYHSPPQPRSTIKLHDHTFDELYPEWALFNHTAAIYQIMTGYTTDKVSPSGQLEPPNAKRFSELRLVISSRLQGRPKNRCSPL